MGYDRGDSFPFDFEPNRFPFGSKSNGKLSPWLYPIQCEKKWKYSFLSVEAGQANLLISSSQRDNILRRVTFLPFQK